MKKHAVLILFVALACTQVAVPATMLICYESALRHGTVYHFRTRPVDPYDAFRGRYVALALEQTSVPLPKGIRLEHGAKVYAAIEEDPDGFAKFNDVSLDPPTERESIRVEVNYCHNGTVYLRLPFDRYYMNESLAPKAEQAYRQHSVRTQHDAYVTVRAKSGFAILEGLYIGDKPIEEFLRAAD